KKILPPLAGHLTWHLALFYLAQLDEQKVLAQFSPGIWGGMPELSLEQIDAIALLWRMELADMPQDHLLKQVTEKLGQHVYQQYIGFDTAHYVYALARMGHTESVQKIITAAQAFAQHSAPAYQELWLNSGVPLFKGISAFAQGHYKEANLHFAMILPIMAQVGGSDAQIEVFYQTAMVSLLRAGEKDKAHVLLKQYLPYYVPTKIGQRWMQGC
ncbi:MAG TPA: tetratricopeptide repeat protein, partial [Gammaproteobacteria bacterium]|nr:tetratricopeptide repeat protein [Gammaproteobacteria bacterium]